MDPWTRGLQPESAKAAISEERFRVQGLVMGLLGFRVLGLGFRSASRRGFHRALSFRFDSSLLR